MSPAEIMQAISRIKASVPDFDPERYAFRVTNEEKGALVQFIHDYRRFDAPDEIDLLSDDVPMYVLGVQIVPKI